MLIVMTGLNLILPLASAQDNQIWTTTADFDAGIYAVSNGNREINSNTDNFRISSNQIELENIGADTFSIEDLDANSFKWTPEERGAAADDCSIFRIADGTVSISIVVDSITVECVIGNDASVSGVIDIRFKFSTPTNGANSVGGICLLNEPQVGCIGSFVDWDGTTVDGIHYRWLVDDLLDAYTVTDGTGTLVGSQTDLPGVSVSDPIWLRITRDGTTVTFYYSFNGISWTTDETTTFTTSSSLYVSASIGDSSVADLSATIDDYRLQSGIIGTGGFRTFGNWTSSQIVIPSDEIATMVRLTHSGLSATYAIDRVQFLRNGVILETQEDDIISGTQTDIFLSGDFVENSLFNVRITLKGNGDGTPTLESVTVFLSSITRAGNNSIELIIFIILFVLFIFMFIVGLYNRFVMIGSGIVSVFLAIQSWIITESPFIPAFFIFITAICIGYSFTKT